MTIEKSTFAEAKKLLSTFKDAKPLPIGIADNHDTTFARFSIPLRDEPSTATLYLLYSALQSEFGNGSLHAEDDRIVVSLPTSEVSESKLPTHRLEQGLHRVRKTLLNALEQNNDGQFVINKQRMGTMQGITHIDLEDLTQALLKAHVAHGGTALKDPVVEPTYKLPDGMIYIDGESLRHRGEVKQTTYANFISEKQQAGQLYTPFNQAEQRLQVDADVLRVIYKELGVEMQPGRAN